jgi:hypothetical protein
VEKQKKDPDTHVVTVNCSINSWLPYVDRVERMTAQPLSLGDHDDMKHRLVLWSSKQSCWQLTSRAMEIPMP